MNDGRQAPTLADVAARAQVSTATVSRCINFPDRVAEDTRQRVTEAINDLGYSPNFGARVMAARRTMTVGAIIPTMENAIFARGLQAFQEELGNHGYTLLVASSSYRADLERDQIKALVARGADALLLIGHDRDPEIYRFLEARQIPVLVTWAFDPAAPRPSVGFDNRAAMRALADRVIGLGHRNLGLISAEIASNDRARARRDGILDAMAAAGLPRDALTVIETPYGIETGAEAFDTLMQRDAPPTAVLCANDVLAVGALRRARELGLEVPDDVSITGFDDIELAQVALPALTTVHVPHRDMGRRAARMLVAALEGGPAPEPTLLQATLTMRDSLGPVPKPG
ncbi:LacI family DNA-binding transcriptional regulator [Aestuariicoccus sp. MJ-SS9]|uniref:LacI family DNA-binding transcriptional regulator n=1 Tax=Aestuariicoccus sp. MJ-SS9 TaxID=3079855 RepID=UPI00291500B9|nr:LacI family DNA-binding transcriptional regulator [Aestuariicoccus sp. MJ-SS9]MDU8911585.1 LacI family DNA-binding transcriptional regulator [Aestuariicoccus sp. MJ-SS9]